MLELIKGFQKMNGEKDQASLYNILVGQLDRNFRKIQEGPPSGYITLVAGTITVSDPRVMGNSIILLTSQVDGGTPGWLRVQSRIEGSSFVIISSSATDTSVVGWQIIK